MTYGMPYQGSKNAIAEDIIDFLPSGKRLVDLFGGGGAITHCASLSNKWESVLYNEINPLIYKGFKMALGGDFNNETRWISHEDFFRLRDTDPYVALCFSFGNTCRSYKYSKNIETYMKCIHYALMLNDWSLLNASGLTKSNFYEELKYNKKKYSEYYNVPVGYLLRKPHLECLERLKVLNCLKSRNIELTNNTYLNYTYEEGDVVYCDIPYEKTDTRCYGDFKVFDSEEFYEWCRTREYQVFFSSYRLKKDVEGIYEVWNKNKYVVFNSYRNHKTEIIYSNKPYIRNNKFIFGV